VTAHAAILLAPPVERQFGNADLANGIRHRHALAAQNLNLPKLRDDLVGLVSLVGHCGPPSWSKPYFKVDPFNGGGSVQPNGTLAPIGDTDRYTFKLHRLACCRFRGHRDKVFNGTGEL